MAVKLNYPWTEINSKATYKLKENKILVTVKGSIDGKKFKFKETYAKLTDDIEYTYGEELFGIQIGKTIDNYKLGSEVLDGDENFSVKKTIIYLSSKSKRRIWGLFNKIFKINKTNL